MSTYGASRPRRLTAASACARSQCSTDSQRIRAGAQEEKEEARRGGASGQDAARSAHHQAVLVRWPSRALSDAAGHRARPPRPRPRRRRPSGSRRRPSRRSSISRGRARASALTHRPLTPSQRVRISRASVICWTRLPGPERRRGGRVHGRLRAAPLSASASRFPWPDDTPV